MSGGAGAAGRRPSFRELPSAPRPIDAFEALYSDWAASSPPAAGRTVRQEPPALLFSGMDPGKLGRWSFIALHPFARLVSKGDAVEVSDLRRSRRSRGDPLEALRRLLRRFATEPVPGRPPFQGGAVGHISYECNRFVERVPATNPDDLGLPDVYLVLYDTVLAYDHEGGTAVALSNGLSGDAQERLDAVAARLAKVAPSIRPWREPFPPPPEPATSPAVLLARYAPSREDPYILTEEGYGMRVAACREHLLAGDIYEVNFTHRISRPYRGGAWELFKETARINPAPFSAFLDRGDSWVVSASPERFFSKRGRAMECRPMKGTRQRSLVPEEDRAMAEDLRTSPKDRAENLMICDLIRNDLGRICTIGSVRVPELMVVESYATVHQMVSSVVGELAEGRDLVDCLRALFPGGSMTGAPKVSAMGVIDETENVVRGIYSGCIGYLGLDGDADLDIVIRTVVLRGGRAYVNVGGAIVADSTVKGEHEESLLKARALLQAMANVEGP